MMKPAYIAAREQARGRDGRFGSYQSGESGVDPIEDQDDWGATPVIPVHSKSMWGPVVGTSKYADGVLYVHTASHGGFNLSPERNRVIPAALQNLNGWYEEDAEVHIVEMYHPDAFAHSADTEDEIARRGEDGVRQWFPEGYEKATGTVIPFGESSEKDAAAFRAEHADAWMLAGAGGHNIHTDDDGTRYVRLRRVGDISQDVWVEMSEETQHEIDMQRTDFGAAPAYMLPVLVGPDHMTRTVGDPRPGLVKHYGIKDYSNRSVATVAKIEKDLNKQWRDDDGRVRTLRDIIENEGVSEKKVIVEGGRRAYYLSQQVEPGSNTWTALKVSKDTWDVVDAPDNRTPVDEAREGYLIASSKYDAARDKVAESWRPSTAELLEVRTTGIAVQAAKENLDAVRESWTAQAKAELAGDS